MPAQDWVVQSPWPDAEVLVDGEPTAVDSDGLFRVLLSQGRVHEIRAGAKMAFQRAFSAICLVFASGPLTDRCFGPAF